METTERTRPRARRSFTPEFKADIVEACQRGDRTIVQVCRDFDLTETAVRAWVRQAEIDSGQRAGTSTEDAQRIAVLERENRELKRANDILKAASAFFAREMDPRPPR